MPPRGTRKKPEAREHPPLAIPGHVLERLKREQQRLEGVPPDTADRHQAREWIERIEALPWRVTTPVAGDLSRIRRTLQREMTAPTEVIDATLDCLSSLASGVRAPQPPICLTGPRGVGKSTFSRSLAKALGRPFVRISLGGQGDASFIRGVRPSLPGSVPGRVIDAIAEAGTWDPVILLEDVDEVLATPDGGLIPALKELLRDDGRSAFHDLWFGVPFDLSQTLLVVTAASTRGIPELLRDHLDLVSFPGYIESEKLEIARRHLIPRAQEKLGLERGSVRFPADAVSAIVRGWTHEAGVRGLERRICQVMQRVVRNHVQAQRKEREPQKPLPATVITPDMLPDILGPETRRTKRFDQSDSVGVAKSLAYTPSGGEILAIEATALPGRGRLQFTGRLGEVLRESAYAAIGFIREHSSELGVPEDFHRSSDIHVHIPGGADPKDGPSAGAAIAVAVASALTGIPVRGKVLITGETTLKGRILPIGGVREKIAAALERGLTEIVAPADNAPEIRKLPAPLRRGARWHLVSTLDEVLRIALKREQPKASTSKSASHGH